METTIDRTDNSTVAWIGGAVLALILISAVWYAFAGSSAPGIPNTGDTAPTTQTTPTNGATNNY